MVKKVEKAILPDGTIYQLETTWCKDPDYHIKHTTCIQTSPQKDNNKEKKRERNKLGNKFKIFIIFYKFVGKR